MGLACFVLMSFLSAWQAGGVIVKDYFFFVLVILKKNRSSSLISVMLDCHAGPDPSHTPAGKDALWLNKRDHAHFIQ